MGDIMSDISSKRRGTVMGMNAEGGMQTVEAEVPIAEMSSYAIDLRSMTQAAAASRSTSSATPRPPPTCSRRSSRTRRRKPTS